MMKANQNKPPQKAKPGELMLWIGVAALCAAPFFYMMLANGDAKNAAMVAEGVVSAAKVENKDVRKESHSSSRGRTRTSTVYYLNVRYDFNARTKYSDWKQTGTFTPSTAPAITTGDVKVPKSIYERTDIGKETTVVWLPTDYETIKTVAQFENEMSPAYHMKWYAGILALTGLGAGLTVMGWRKRKAAAIATA